MRINVFYPTVGNRSTRIDRMGNQYDFWTWLAAIKVIPARSQGYRFAVPLLRCRGESGDTSDPRIPGRYRYPKAHWGPLMGRNRYAGRYPITLTAIFCTNSATNKKETTSRYCNRRRRRNFAGSKLVEGGHFWKLLGRANVGKTGISFGCSCILNCTNNNKKWQHVRHFTLNSAAVKCFGENAGVPPANGLKYCNKSTRCWRRCRHQTSVLL